MRLRLALSPLLLLLAAQNAQATIIDFESVTDMGIISSSTEVQGYLFESEHYHINTARSGGAWNGTNFIGEEGGGRGLAVTMTQADGGTFALFGLDSAEFLPGYGLDSDFPNAKFLDVQGTLIDGSSIVQRLTLELVADGRFGLDDFQSFLLDERFNNLLSVTFQGWALDGREGGLALDNIWVQPTSVPEPATLSLMALGLLGAGLVRRRKLATRE